MVSAPGNMYMSAELALANTAQTGRSSRSRAEGVTHIAHRLDVPPVDLGAEAADVHLEHVAAGVEAEAPHVRQQLVTRAHLTRAAHQVAEEDELTLRQGRAAIALVQDASLQVQTHGAHLQPARRCRSRRVGEP